MIISLEELRSFVGIALYGALVPTTFFLKRKTVKQAILRELKVRFLLLREIRHKEFYDIRKEEPVEHRSSEDLLFFGLNYVVGLEEIQSIVEEVLQKKGFNVFSSCIIDNSLCTLKIRKKKRLQQIRITVGKSVPHSFCISVTDL
jgi:hypothetical protein